MVKRVAVLGPAGTNGHEAGSRLIGGGESEFVFCRSNVEVMEKVALGGVDYGVVPVHNNSTGLIADVGRYWTNQSADFESRKLYPVMEIVLPIRHCLLVHPDFTEGTGVKKIISHPEALKQCRKVIEEYGVADEVAALSTADAARVVSSSGTDSGLAALASGFAAQVHGLKALKEDVQDNDGNKTTFQLLSREKARATSNCKTAIMFWIKHETGSLVNALGIISFSRRNMLFLDSVFSGDNANIGWYVEFEGHKDDPVTKQILGLLGHVTKKLLVLGSFSELLYV